MLDRLTCKQQHRDTHVNQVYINIISTPVTVNKIVTVLITKFRFPFSLCASAFAQILDGNDRQSCFLRNNTNNRNNGSIIHVMGTKS